MPNLKRELLRPFIRIQRELKKLNHPIRMPEEIIEMRDKIHNDFIIAEKKNNNDKMIEFKAKKDILNWVLKNE